MIALPLVVGSLHFTMTSDPLISVVGADGVAGAEAARIDTIEENALSPIALRAFTLN